MDVTPLVASNAQIVQSYKDGQFRISGQLYDGAIAVRPTEVTEWTHQKDRVDQLGIDDIRPFVKDNEVILLGTGGQMAILPRELRQCLRQAAIHLEVMDTGAACRTYNVLLAEGRDVVALLLPSK